MFWQITATHKHTGSEETLIVQSPDYTAERVIKDISSVHPELENFVAEEIDRPKWVEKAYGDPES
jgi:hypothetical protein